MDTNTQTVQSAQTINMPATSQPRYAGFGIRFVAALIDAILVSVVSSILGSVLGIAKTTTIDGVTTYSNPLNSFLPIIYMVIADVKYGTTIGKKLLKLRVQHETTGANLTVGEAILREFVGRLVSIIPLFLGYFWVIFDQKKQGWHDKIGKSVVVYTD